MTSKKAAIEIGDASYGATPTYNVTVSGTTVNGYEINNEGFNTGTTLWGNKNSMPAERLNVTIDGVNVYLSNYYVLHPLFGCRTIMKLYHPFDRYIYIKH